MTLLIFVFLVVLIAGVPVFIALAGSSLIYTHFLAGIPDFVILHRMAGGIDSFPLLAVPFFILAGNLMNSAGITNRIYDFAVALCGWMRGGLAHVNIIGSVIFAGMSGTAIADAAGLGTIEIKAMKDHGYGTEFSVGVTAASATLGPIIPPSLPFVIYGMMANVSIGALFMGGFIPGAVMTIFMMLYVTYCARKYNMGRDQLFNWKVLGLTFIAALPPLLTPAIIMGGMTFGCFLEPIASISILVPVLMPVITKIGIDPVHFGVVMTLNLMIGLLHPPLGMVLFVLARISKLSIERTTMAILPWLIPLLASLVAITLIPELTLWLPRTVGLIK